MTIKQSELLNEMERNVRFATHTVVLAKHNVPRVNLSEATNVLNAYVESLVKAYEMLYPELTTTDAYKTAFNIRDASMDRYEKQWESEHKEG